MQIIIYFFVTLVLVSGLFIMLTSDNYLRKIIGLILFQTSIVLFYITLAKLVKTPIHINFNNSHKFFNPLPQALMLTAIVVGFSTMSLGLGLIRKIYTEYGTLSEIEITQKEDNDFIN